MQDLRHVSTEQKRQVRGDAARAAAVFQGRANLSKKVKHLRGSAADRYGLSETCEDQPHFSRCEGTASQGPSPISDGS